MINEYAGGAMSPADDKQPTFIYLCCDQRADAMLRIPQALMTGTRRAHRKMLMLVSSLYEPYARKECIQQEAHVSMAGGRGIARRRQQH
jgi:hypothetical protein